MAQRRVEFQIKQDEDQFEELINQYVNEQVMLNDDVVVDDKKYVYCDDDEIRFLSRDE